MTGLSWQSVGLGQGPTLEVRWILPGNLASWTREWFSRFPAATESREDDYLIGPDLAELSVKIRGGSALEVKMHRGLLGVLEIPGRAQGVMEFWHKWSFPLRSMRQAADSSSWRTVRKIRRMTFFSVEAGRVPVSVGQLRTGAGCAVELTEVTMLGQDWWSLGFEAIGPTAELRDMVELTAAHVFGQMLVDEVEFTLDQSCSYSTWLRELVQIR